MDVDVRFGPFTCIAGANGAGKSNLFDAIRFLSSLANQSLVEAAKAVRDEHGKDNDVRSLFHRIDNNYADKMVFVVEMIVPPSAIDDYGQIAKAQSTFLRYTLELGWRKEATEGPTSNPLEVLKEDLTHVKRAEADKHILFKHDRNGWRKTVVTGAVQDRRGYAYISTKVSDSPDEPRTIQVHQDRGAAPKKDKSGKGPAYGRLASNLPRTILSSAQAAESPTALCARREMQSWRLLQLEPAELRQHDEFSSPTLMTSTGRHLPATLNRLANKGDADAVYCQVANRLSELIGDVKSIRVDRDNKRETLTLCLSGMDKTEYPARALSDGTLRFLALTVLELDSEAGGIICLEEPENGIHPDRIPAILKLLQDMCADVEEPAGPENPLRQVIINTHSPSVVAAVPEDCLLLAKTVEAVSEKKHFSKVVFLAVNGTWRTKILNEQASIVSRGDILTYLNPLGLIRAATTPEFTPPNELLPTPKQRIIDNPEFQMLLGV